MDVRPGAVLFSGHHPNSRRRANFHFLADALIRRGYDVTFVTVQISPLSWLRRDARFDQPILREANRLIAHGPHLRGYVWFTPFHPVHLRSSLADRLTAPLARLYGALPMRGLTDVVRSARLIMVESTAALLMVERLRRLNPAARLVYRVSDDVRTLGLHRSIVTVEAQVAPLFDLISVPARQGVRRFGGLSTVRLHPHCIDARAFAGPHRNPYSGPRNAVSIGHSFHDPDLVPAAARAFPEWTFHVIGRVPRSADLPNIRWYGEIPFVETIPHLIHADVGLAPYRYRIGAESLADSSLKMMQYTWCRLPVVAPDFAASQDRPHVMGYRPGDAGSIRDAFAAAAAYDRTNIDRSMIRSWDELAHAIAETDHEDLPPRIVVPFERRR